MLAILTTHPIQYQVPLWQALARDGRVPFEVWYLTRHAVKSSHDAEFGKAFAWDIDMLEGYPHRFLDMAPGATPTSFLGCRLRERLRDRLIESKVTALWIQGWQVVAYWQAVREARAAGIEVWLRAESNDLAPIPWWKRPLKRIQLGWLFSRVSRFLYIGSANKRLYLKHGVPGSRLHPAPYAVDNDRFAKQAEGIRGRRSEIRRQWAIPEDAFCVLFCGKFIPKKRPMDLIKAARLFSAPTSDLRPPTSGPAKLHLLFVGSGELGPQLREQCNVVFDAENPSSQFPSARPSDLSVSASPNVRVSASLPPASFTGFLNQTEISQAYVAADCLVLPSDYGETWGLVANEAMASGLPCVISDHCGCAEDLGVIPPSQVFPCGDSEAIANRLAHLSQSVERYRVPFGALAGFSLASSVQAVLKAWQRCVLQRN